MPISANRMYLVKEVAAILGYRELTIMCYIRAGTLPHYQCRGERYRISGRAIVSILGINGEFKRLADRRRVSLVRRICLQKKI